MKDLSLLQKIYDICEARIQCNIGLIEHIKSINSIQEFMDSGILAENKRNTLFKQELSERLFTDKKCVLDSIDADKNRYEDIKKQIIDIANLIDIANKYIANFKIEEDININHPKKSFQIQYKLIETYDIFIMSFWLEEETYKKNDLYNKNFREYYYVNLIKEWWEKLLPISFNCFDKEYRFTVKDKYNNYDKSLKISDRHNRIKFKEREYRNFINHVSKEYKSLNIQLQKLKLKSTNEFNRLRERIEEAKAKVLNFYGYCDDTIHVHKLVKTTNFIFDEATSSNSSDLFQVVIFFAKEQYILYIACTYLNRVFAELNNELNLKKNNQLLLNKSYAIKVENLKKQLEALVVRENKNRAKTYKEEDTLRKDILFRQQQESSIIIQELTLESLKFTESLDRKNIEDKELQIREKMCITFQRDIQKQVNLARQPKNHANITNKVILADTNAQQKFILDTRKFVIDQKIVSENFRDLENLMDNTNSLTFQKAKNLVIALGGRIESNHAGGSHHKILFQERVSSCFDTVASIVRPHGKDKENVISGFALKAFKAAIIIILLEDWRSLKVLKEANKLFVMT